MIVVSGASGAGKTTVLHHIEQDLGIQLTYLPSYTTREPRASDESGMQYLTKEEFAQMDARGEFLWTRHVHGNSYGTRREDVGVLMRGDTLVATILTPDRLPHMHDSLTALSVPQNAVLFLHVLHPGEMVLRERLAARGDAPEKIQIRIEECREWDAYVRALPFPIVMFDNTANSDALVERLKTLFDS